MDKLVYGQYTWFFLVDTTKQVSTKKIYDLDMIWFNTENEIDSFVL